MRCAVQPFNRAQIFTCGGETSPVPGALRGWQEKNTHARRVGVALWIEFNRDISYRGVRMINRDWSPSLKGGSGGPFGTHSATAGKALSSPASFE